MKGVEWRQSPQGAGSGVRAVSVCVGDIGRKECDVALRVRDEYDIATEVCCERKGFTSFGEVRLCRVLLLMKAAP